MRLKGGYADPWFWWFCSIMVIGGVICIGIILTTTFAATPFRVNFTLNGLPFAGATNSDCQPYSANSGQAIAINCPARFIAVTMADNPSGHQILPHEWGSTLVASGGGTVQFVLPTTTANGRNWVAFATDGNTGFSVSTLPPTTLQGSSLINNGVLTAGPNADGWAGLSGTMWQINVR